MKKIHPNTIGLITGVILGGMHLLWSMMIALGLGQLYLDWIFGLHSLNNPFVVMEFSIDRTIYLVIFTFIVGYVLGWVATWMCKNVWPKK
ncbi:MAG: hypothetical protein UV63_C0008G0019 [Microgenomates group bacterium GW2011_GWC1_43_11]|uniref:DUF2062 domain-containing protein n=2 Tax=Candidatus Gottesmaniibacteriota TaxID=1752720 RepID=A0A0G1LNP1_9BACT|nr:MAG: hypothetical protein UV63_C0008G0019 [Microgenomates group bacterium GW2011_GWC1_43_11]KKT39042.1 MAG: hypothetical protein UW22_C0002G0018 [Candidatus Gottesmanbacteria bacterium GW2011_GWB1_44_11c]KKT61504.1 MAG: hypothetical protein UW52_C0002G0018 [Candidatus Gottesmanbacteria bacterium GW2011_GWA1_44_24b]HCM81901.1 hypothetical protein [Patescibacteria group bacterium]